jgi:hypothetical protein
VIREAVDLFLEQQVRPDRRAAVQAFLTAGQANPGSPLGDWEAIKHDPYSIDGLDPA